MASHGLQRAVFITLNYSDHFGFPLTLPELHLRLIKYQISRAALERSLPALIRARTIARTGNYYHLPGHTTLVARRLRRARTSAPLLARSHSLSLRLPRVPGILALYLTGSLAVKNATPSSDLDLLVVTRPGRLWTTRLLLTLYTTILGLRRTPTSTHNAGKLCLNLYLTPVSYELPLTRRSLYTAYELIQAVPLYDPHHTHPQLLAANQWLKAFLPNFSLPKKPVPSPIIRNSLFIILCERTAYALQRWYMHPRLTREFVTAHSAFFHPRDPGTKVMRKLAL